MADKDRIRTEQDLLGSVQIPEDALYGIHTVRAMDNFHLHGQTVNYQLIRGIVTVKKAAALTYEKLHAEKKEVYHAIAEACDEVLDQDMRKHFPVQALQGGAGTSTNMNVNEVLANLALIRLGHRPGEYQYVHPIDDVNRGQSTNDVYPTGLRIAAIRQLRALSEECAHLQTALQEKENAYQDIKKLGRTELMDAVPITLGQEFGAYAQAIARDRWRLYKVEERLRQVNLGGTAVGGSDASERKYRFRVIEELRNLTGLGLAAAEYPMDITQNMDVYVEVSGLLKALAVNLMKIANDLRLMNSGPDGGFGEIRLQSLQQGSSIMPGKVNPVIPEMVMQVSMRVCANDTAIAMAAAHGEFELNAFGPLMAESILESLELMTDAVHIFREKAIRTVKAREDICKERLEKSSAFATGYISELGYDYVSQIISKYEPKEAKQILDETLKQTTQQKGQRSDE